MPLDLRLVESFVAVAEARSFSIAAERLNTVQSAISAHIKQLERQANRPLVARGRGKPVALTKQGAAFLVQARRLLALADEIARSPGGAADPAPLRLGTSVTFALSVVPIALSEFGSATGGMQATVQTARSHDLIDLLDDGAIDVALVFDQGVHPGRQWTIENELSWAAADTFATTATGIVTLAFLEDARDLRRHAFAAIDKSGGFRTSLTTHPDPIGMRAVVTAGLAATVLPRVAIVPPLIDVGKRLGLPQLGTLPVSLYTSNGASEDRISHLSRRLRWALTGHREMTSAPKPPRT
ncbi:MAG: LysR family transcriptional regulator [Pseudomonadota bacterium]